jgi:hypothetical protein
LIMVHQQHTFATAFEVIRHKPGLVLMGCVLLAFAANAQAEAFGFCKSSCSFAFKDCMFETSTAPEVCSSVLNSCLQACYDDAAPRLDTTAEPAE